MSGGESGEGDRVKDSQLTVGELIARLSEFDENMTVVVADSLRGDSNNWDFLFGVALLPPDNDKVALFKLDRPD